LLPLFFNIIIGPDINALFIVDIEGAHRRKILGDIKFISGPDLCR
jgi:hypothetical protein